MKMVATAAAAVLIGSQAFAGTYEQRCETTSTPYQETVKGGSPEKVIGGAVVGGVIGQVVTKKTAGAAAGAVIGGVVANETSKKTVTKYKDVQNCRTVFVPAVVADQATLRQALQDLQYGRPVSKEMIMDVQYTIGVAHDGKWGPKSQQAADAYLANLGAAAPTAGPLYSLVVNNVVITTSADVGEVDAMQKALLEAGVNSQISVAMQ